MTVDTALAFMTRWAFVMITAILAIQYVRHRDRTRRDTMLMFGAFGFGILVGEAARLLKIGGPWPAKLSGASIVTQPYLLLLLVEQFREVSRRAKRWAALAMAGSVALLLLGPQPLPPRLILIVIVYFAVVEGYAALELLRVAHGRPGISRHRVRLIGQGSAMLAGVILLAGVQIASPALRPIIQPASRLLALLVALWYYVGFLPPAGLRRVWQLEELHAFLRRLAGRTSSDRVAMIADDLSKASLRAAGGLAALTLIADKHDSRLQVQGVAGGSTEVSALPLEGPVRGIWERRSPAIIYTKDLTGPLADALTRLGAGAALAVPIASHEHRWGIILVLQHRTSLYPGDDLEVLRLLGDHSALVLDVGQLLSEQQSLIARLHQSTQELEAANKELEAFSYSVSHDLRAPLRAIDGFTRILVDEYLPSLPAEAGRYFQTVRDNARQMGQLIDDLLGFSRLGRHPVRRRLLDPAPVVREALDELRQERDGRAVEIVIGDLADCRADPALLRQLYVNLLSNALKFTRPVPAPRIDVGTTRRDGEVVYFVKDNGVGFDMRYAHKLFGVFQRLHRPEEFEGTGVGLAIVQRIVHRHGGRVWAEAGVNQGATFYFTLGGEPSNEPLDGGDPAGRRQSG